MSPLPTDIGEPNLKEESEIGPSSSFDVGKTLLENRLPVTMSIVGLLLIGAGIIYYKSAESKDSSNIEVITTTETKDSHTEVIVELSGAVEKAGVYKLKPDSRVEDLLIASGGLSSEADREWVERMINRAAKLTDGQKIYIPYQSDVLSAENNGDVKVYQGISGGVDQGVVNINTSSQNQLETLPGIGPVYAQKIIEHRPYSNVDELLSREVLKENLYQKIKDQITAY